MAGMFRTKGQTSGAQKRMFCSKGAVVTEFCAVQMTMRDPSPTVWQIQFAMHPRRLSKVISSCVFRPGLERCPQALTGMNELMRKTLERVSTY